jgi:hypothetical protein
MFAKKIVIFTTAVFKFDQLTSLNIFRLHLSFKSNLLRLHFMQHSILILFEAFCGVRK